MAKYIAVPFATTGDTTTVPDAVQPDGSVSMSEGYTADYAKDQATDPNAKDIPRQSENYLKLLMTDAIKELQERGFKVYDPDVNYPVSSYTIGSNGLTYKSDIVNGPASAIVDPVGDVSGAWFKWGFTEAIIRAFAASTTQKGTAERATDTEALTFTDVERFVNSKQLGLVAGLVQTNNYLTGFESSVNVADANGLDILGGQCRDSTNSVTMNGAPETKLINANWADGDGVGGFPASLVLTDGTWYYLHGLVKANGDGGYGWDTSPTAANLLADPAVVAAGFTLYRHLWFSYYINAASKIFPIIQDGDVGMYDAAEFEAIGSPLPVVPTEYPSFIPPGPVTAFVRVGGTTSVATAGPLHGYIDSALYSLKAPDATHNNFLITGSTPESIHSNFVARIKTANQRIRMIYDSAGAVTLWKHIDGFEFKR